MIRTFRLATHRVVSDSLLGREVAPPCRRLAAFAIDAALLLGPTILAAVCFAAGSLRVMDPPAYRAMRALWSGEVRTEAQTLDAMAALLPRMVEIGSAGLPLEAITATRAGRPREAAAFLRDASVEFSLTFGRDDDRPTRPGQVRVPVANLIPGAVRGAAIFLVPAVYFTLLGLGSGRTIGKRLCGLEVRRLDGRPLTLPESFDRFGGYAQVPGTLFTGLADLWRDPNRRLAHDRSANTVVLRRSRGRGQA